MTIKSINEYLGDGLYVGFDGYQFRLYAPRVEGVHEVYLEPHILNKFNNFVTRMTAREPRTAAGSLD